MIRRSDNSQGHIEASCHEIFSSISIDLIYLANLFASTFVFSRFNVLKSNQDACTGLDISNGNVRV